MSRRDHHPPCPGGCGELADECMTPGCGSPLGSMRVEPAIGSRATCARCGRAALGYATINGVRYCHGDERSCYTEQHRDDTWGRVR